MEAAELGKAVRGAVDASGETPEAFKCNICLLLVFQPEQCAACDQIFCKECIGGWVASKSKGQCPLCQDTKGFNPMNRMVKRFLDQTQLRGCPSGDSCPKHETPIQYEQLIPHLQKECPQVLVACPS